MSKIPALGRQRQEDFKFKVSLSYTINSFKEGKKKGKRSFKCSESKGIGPDVLLSPLPKVLRLLSHQQYKREEERKSKYTPAALW
jgi:hypothetical protein